MYTFLWKLLKYDVALWKMSVKTEPTYIIFIQNYADLSSFRGPSLT